MPPLDMPLNLQTLAQRPDEWSYVAKFLTLKDLARLRAVSTQFREVVTPAQMEKAALEILRRGEGDNVSVDDLRHVRLHPAVQGLADNHGPASACLASLYYTVNPSGEQRVSEQIVNPIIPQVRTLDLATRSLTRDGRVVVWGLDAQNRIVAKYVVRGGEMEPLVLPHGFTTVPSMCRSSVCKQFLHLPPDCWLLMNADDELHCYDAGDGGLTRLPLPRSTMPHTTDLSRSGRFIATATIIAEGPGETRLQCYDRLLDRISVDVHIADVNLFQISVADDGRLFVGSHTSGYAFNLSGEVTRYPYEGGYNALFRLSPDERFLIRSCFRHNEDGDNILLQDLHDGRETILPRLMPSRVGGGSTRPGSLAFSLLNRLVAVAYEDGALQVFDLQREDDRGAHALVRTSLPISGISMQPHVSFDGFGRIHTVFRQRSGEEISLTMHTLSLDRPERTP